MPSTSSSTPCVSVSGASRSDIHVVTSAMKSAVTSVLTSSGTPPASHAATSSSSGRNPRQTTTHAGSLASSVLMPSSRAGAWSAR